MKKVKKEPAKKVFSKNLEDIKTEKILVENFVILQKVLTQLSEKTDKLTTQISKLLEIFENSAEALARRDFKSEQTEETGKILQGIKELSEQNKIIARGLTLVHETRAPEQYPQAQYIQETLPTPIKRASVEMENYGESISDKIKRLRPLPKQ